MGARLWSWPPPGLLSKHPMLVLGIILYSPAAHGGRLQKCEVSADSNTDSSASGCRCSYHWDNYNVFESAIESATESANQLHNPILKISNVKFLHIQLICILQNGTCYRICRIWICRFFTLLQYWFRYDMWAINFLIPVRDHVWFSILWFSRLFLPLNTYFSEKTQNVVRKMQLDVGNEPYLSKQKYHADLLTRIFPRV